MDLLPTRWNDCGARTMGTSYIRRASRWPTKRRRHCSALLRQEPRRHTGEPSRLAARHGHTVGVGFNPFGPRRRSPADLAMVVAALVVCAALVGWALFG